MQGAVAFIVKGYPRLSETFIAQEIRALERRGLKIRIISLRRPHDTMRHPIHGEIEAPVVYLPEYLHQETARVARAWRALRGRSGYRRARTVWRKDLARDRTRNRVRRFGQALVLAHELPDDVSHLHAHFLHTPASVTRYAAKLLDLPWSCSAHAKDIYTTPDWDKAEKLADCAWAVTCTRTNQEYLATLAPPERVSLAYHGLDLDRFPPRGEPRPARDGRASDDPVVLLSVGRAVEKKGYDDLLEALARLPAELHWRFEHIGDGPLLGRLQARAAQLGLDHRLRWRGAQAQEAVLEAYRAADLFVLASRKARSGDQDGLPNVLMEAQSQALAVVATRISAVPELIEDGVTGHLVAPRAVDALAATLARLIADPKARARLGAAGLERLRERFALDLGLEVLTARFALARVAA
jgi:glycosyltransferase involved in cell wall biosynthesis